MTAFDPTVDRGEQSNSSKYSDGNLPPGDYLLVGKYLLMRTAKTSGMDYARIVVEVLEGPAKGASFWQFQGLDMTKDGSRKRLGWWCQAAGVDYSFDPGRVEELAGALLLRPFKASVSRKKDRSNGEWQNDISRFALPKAKGEVNAQEVHLLAEHREKFEDWRTNYKDDRSSADSTYYQSDGPGDDAPPPPSDDDFGGTPRQQDFDDGLPF